jgi:two-component system chemotaxis response regulator CheB
VIGVVLTGMLDDGTAGLWSIKDRGGVAIVQSPAEAQYPSMPSSALQHVAVDYTLRISEMPTRLQALTRTRVPDQEAAPMSDRKLETEVGIAHGDAGLHDRLREFGTQAFYTCPECQGSMIRIEEGSIQRFRCHTGHAFSKSALAVEQPRAIERSLWSTLAQLEEHHELLLELDDRSLRPAEAAQHTERLEAVEALIRQVRSLAIDPALRPGESSGESTGDNRALDRTGSG